VSAQRLSEQPQSIVAIRTSVGATRFYVIRTAPEPPNISQLIVTGLIRAVSRAASEAENRPRRFPFATPQGG